MNGEKGKLGPMLYAKVYEVSDNFCLPVDLNLSEYDGLIKLWFVFKECKTSINTLWMSKTAYEKNKANFEDKLNISSSKIKYEGAAECSITNKSRKNRLVQLFNFFWDINYGNVLALFALIGIIIIFFNFEPESSTILKFEPNKFGSNNKLNFVDKEKILVLLHIENKSIMDMQYKINDIQIKAERKPANNYESVSHDVDSKIFAVGSEKDLDLPIEIDKGLTPGDYRLRVNITISNKYGFFSKNQFYFWSLKIWKQREWKITSAESIPTQTSPYYCKIGFTYNPGIDFPEGDKATIDIKHYERYPGIALEDLKEIEFDWINEILSGDGTNKILFNIKKIIKFKSYDAEFKVATDYRYDCKTLSKLIVFTPPGETSYDL